MVAASNRQPTGTHHIAIPKALEGRTSAAVRRLVAFGVVAPVRTVNAPKGRAGARSQHAPAQQGTSSKRTISRVAGRVGRAHRPTVHSPRRHAETLPARASRLEGRGRPVTILGHTVLIVHMAPKSRVSAAPPAAEGRRLLGPVPHQVDHLLASPSGVERSLDYLDLNQLRTGMGRKPSNLSPRASNKATAV